MYQLKKYRKLQSGFTLIEIAIVLVIIGLLLGGVLKGQEMITSAKIKRVNNDFNGISAAIYAYLDRYNAMPGDDINANTRWGSDAGDGSGIVDNNWDGQTATEEATEMWDHLRQASLISGSGVTLPGNPFGGLIGVMNSNFGIAGGVVCMNAVPGDIAELIDLQFDDGVSDTGTMRANSAATVNAAGTAPPWVAANTYTICNKL